MANLTKWFSAGAMAIAIMGSPAHAETAEGPRMVELPVNGPLFMRETASGATVIVSSDGRFVMPGRLVDRQENHAVISSIDEAESAFGNASVATGAAGGSSASSLVTEDGFPDAEKLLSFSVGSGPKTVYVWVDPLCPYCHKVVEMQEQMGEEFTFHNLIVPLLGERSERATDALACMPESERHEAMKANRYGSPKGSCDEKGLANSQRLSTIMQVAAVPTIISPNRQSVTGAPSSVDQFAEFLRGNN